MAEMCTAGQAAELLGVSVDTVRRLADQGELAAVRAANGRRQFDRTELARYAARSGSAARHAKAPKPRRIRGESARNRFPGIVTKVTKDKVMAQVEMQAGPFRVVSLMSSEAADELGLAPGVLAVASVKATNVVVEIPE